MTSISVRQETPSDMGERSTSREPSSDVLHHLLEQLLVVPNAPALWAAIGQACARVTGAETSEVYVYNQSTRELRRVEREQACPVAGPEPASRYTLGLPISSSSRYAVAKAARQARVVEYRGPTGTTKLAVPLCGHPDWDTPPSA